MGALMVWVDARAGSASGSTKEDRQEDTSIW